MERLNEGTSSGPDWNSNEQKTKRLLTINHKKSFYFMLCIMERGFKKNVLYFLSIIAHV